MLDLDYIKQNSDKVKTGVQNKGGDPKIIGRILKLAAERSSAIGASEAVRAQRNEISRQLGSKNLTAAQRKKLLKEAESIKKRLHKAESLLTSVDGLNKFLSSIPNIPFDTVPVGRNAADNVILRKVGKVPKFSFRPKDYMELALQYDLIDIERAGKVSGSRFGYLKNEAVLLEFALVQFAFYELAKEGFAPIIPPVLIKHEIMKNLGYLEKDPDDIYYMPQDDLNLVGTAEHSIVPMFADEIFEAHDLPKRFVGFSTAFRREAGSYGRDTHGILRVHQFDKIEMVSFTSTEKSRLEHKKMLEMQERLMQALKLPYQVVHLCTGDMGFVAAEQFDIESWIPSEGKYRETHSTSNTADFQARRLGIKYRESAKKEFIHILNGTAFAIGRTLIALFENYQQKDGSIAVPKVLHKYCGFSRIA